MKPQSDEYAIDEDDFPYLRARPSWVSPEENPEEI